ncbi:MAG: enoyl-CoA hydratase-related protein [bacterium]
MALRTRIHDRVLVITLDRAAVKNALDRATMEELRDLLDGLAYRDPLPVPPSDATTEVDPAELGERGRYRPHVIVLESAGDVFCAGADLKEMRRLGEADFQTNLAAALDMGAMFRAFRGSPVPVVARVQGPAFGGGVGLVAACDVVVAAPAARFAFTEVRLGLVPGVISPLVVDRIGPTAARRYFLTGARIDAAEAHRIGLVDVVAGDGELDAAVAAVVDDLLKAGPEALSMCKSLLDGVQSLGFARSAEFTARMIAEARTKPEAQAALKAFFAGAAPPWVGDRAWTPHRDEPEKGRP